MTAIVGTLNRKGLALAADSAATMGQTHKVINSANKLFALSKYAPVAIAIYGGSAFMGTPWEVIIKMYRRQLDKKKFDTLQEYANDFITYLHAKSFFNTHEERKQALFAYIVDIYRCLSRQAEDLSRIQGSPAQDCFSAILLQDLAGLKSISDQCVDFKGYKLTEFESDSKEVFDLVYGDSPQYLNDKNRDSFVEMIYYHITKAITPRMSTGVVFAGYGEEEIYPALEEYDISIAFGSRLKYCRKAICSGKDTTIRAFAQGDVVHTIIGGMTPLFSQIVEQALGNTLVAYNKTIAAKVGSLTSDKNLEQEILNLDVDPIIQSLNQNLSKRMHNNYTSKLLNTIGNFDLTDLANMAESLISLTCLVRRMQPGEETVGAPVDVLVISKGDGLIWMKRKHYFDPELNSHFFSNYYQK